MNGAYEVTKGTETTTNVKMVYDHHYTTTVVFREVVPPGEQAKIGTLYLRKEALLPLGNPLAINVTVTVAVES